MVTAFVRGFPGAIVRVFSWRHVCLGVIAGLLTYVCVVSGFDWWFYQSTREVFSLALPAAVIGFFVPILLPVLLYGWGVYKHSKLLVATSVSLAQAGALGWLLSSTLKAFTGRVQPEFYTTLSQTDVSHLFQFGFWRHGIFWGWPSSHVTVAIAMMCVLVFAPMPRSVRIASIVYGLYMVAGVAISIHWFSDALAAVLFGYMAYRAVVLKESDKSAPSESKS